VLEYLVLVYFLVSHWQLTPFHWPCGQWQLTMQHYAEDYEISRRHAYIDDQLATDLSFGKIKWRYFHNRSSDPLHVWGRQMKLYSFDWTKDNRNIGENSARRLIRLSTVKSIYCILLSLWYFLWYLHHQLIDCHICFLSFLLNMIYLSPVMYVN